MRKKTKYDRDPLNRLRNLKWFLAAALLLLVVFRLLLGVARVDGESMAPTLKPGQPVLYCRVIKTYLPGDIISIKMPGGAYYVKRVVATAGDTVDLRDGALWVNGKELTEWGVGRTLPQEESISYPITLQEGQIFAVGDNREGSIDSRTFGPLSRSQIRGRLLFTNR